MRVYVRGDSYRLKNYKTAMLIRSPEYSEDVVTITWMDVNRHMLPDNEWNPKAEYFCQGVDFCDAFFSGDPIFQCGLLLRNKIKVTVILKNIVSGNEIVLDERNVDISAHKQTSIITLVHLGPDSLKCISNENDVFKKSLKGFKCEKAKSIYLEDQKDSIYYYQEVVYSEEPRLKLW